MVSQRVEDQTPIFISDDLHGRCEIEILILHFKGCIFLKIPINLQSGRFG